MAFIHDNATYDGNNAFAVRLYSAASAAQDEPSVATVTIVDDEPKISIAATTPSAQFGANGQVASNGHITITRTGSTAANLTLTLVIGGTAKSNTYAPITSDQTKTVTISAGSSFITLDIVPLLNPTAKRTVTVTCKAVTKSPLAANRFSLDLVNKSAIVNILHV